MNLGAISTLVFDLDGVVWRGDAPIESAITAINRLREAGKRCLFCTNNSSQTQNTFVEKLAGMGLPDVAEADVITSSVATATYLSAQFTGPFLTYVVGSDGIRQALQKIGARIVPDSDITDSTNVDCVVVGIDREFNYAKLDIAQRLIRRGALFVATNRDATYPVESGVIPGAGSIVSAVETAGGSTPVTVGKPRPVMLQLIMQQYDLKPEEMAFVGDRLDTDIVCARRAGVPALLVTTGVTSLADARRAKGEMRPDAVFPELESLAGILLDTMDSPGETSAAGLPAMSAAKAEEISEREIETTQEVEAAPQSTPAVEAVPAEAAPAEAVPANDELLDVPIPKSEGEEGWDESWFDNAEQSAAEEESQAVDELSKVAVSSDELPTIVFDDTENAAAEAVSNEAVPDEAAPGGTAESESAPESASTPDTDSDDGFNWKLD
jgi:4-nitrophenyl phosphatase